ncbi:MAG: hypothetical protein ABH879_06985 [archaeon]
MKAGKNGSEAIIYIIVIAAILLAFSAYFMFIRVFVDSYLRDYSDLYRSQAVFEFYLNPPECNKVYYWGSSSIKEDIDAAIIDRVRPEACHYNLGNPASTPLRRLAELPDAIDSGPGAVVFGVSFMSFSGKWMFPHDQYALVSPYAEIGQCSVPGLLYNQTVMDLAAMNRLELLLYKRKFISPGTRKLLGLLRHRLYGTEKPSYYRDYNTDFKSRGALLPEELHDPEFGARLANKTDFSEYDVPLGMNPEKSAFDYILGELTGNNITVVVLKIPINPLLLEKIPGQYQDNMNAFLGDMAVKHGAAMLDYTSAYNETLFYDGHHLNREGKRLFSRELGEMLEGVV